MDQSPPRRVPKFSSYLKLTAAVWAFLALQTWLLSRLLISSRGVVLLGIILALGFLFVAVFDYCWLRWGKRE